MEKRSGESVQSCGNCRWEASQKEVGKVVYLATSKREKEREREKTREGCKERQNLEESTKETMRGNIGGSIRAVRVGVWDLLTW